MTASPDPYRTSDRNTRSPRTVVLRVYESAVAEIRRAEAALAAGRSPAEPLAKAQTLVGGLMAALDFSAGEMSHRLLSLYLFVSERLQESRAGERDAGLGAAARVLETLLEGWRELPPGVVRADGRSPGEPVGLHLRG